MVQKTRREIHRLDVENRINHGINCQPQLVQDFWTINSINYLLLIHILLWPPVFGFATLHLVLAHVRHVVRERKLQIHQLKYGQFVVVEDTPPKTNMEPKPGGLEDDSPLQRGGFQVP